MTKMRRFGEGALAAMLATLALQASGKSAPGFNVVEASIPQMQAAMKAGRTTSHEIVLQYLARIGAYEDELHAAVTVNSRALAEADALDRERAAGHVRGPLHGIPIALKDNIMTTALPTSGGMLAFKGYMPPYEATLVKNLEAAGAIIIAKSTLSELAGWYGGGMIASPGGYNAAAGQSYNPYDPRAQADGKPMLAVAGSSSGVGVAANLWAVNIGTSTGGSIESPSNANMLVGIRPSTGRVSRYGIIPLSLDQDTAGPMAKTVMDAALVLGALEGDPDPKDPRTTTCKAPPDHDYVRYLKADALKGARIGIPRTGIYTTFPVPGGKPTKALLPEEAQSMNDAIAALKAAGAEVVTSDLPSTVATDPAHSLPRHSICGLTESDFLCSDVVRYTMKRDFNLWLASLGDGRPVKTLTEFLAWNMTHQEEGAIKYGQQRLQMTDQIDLDRDKARYEADRASDLRLTREEGLDAALIGAKVDVVMFPGAGGSNYATKAGYPIITVPFGLVTNDNPEAKGSPDKVRPFGVSFVGPLCGEPRLLAIAYGFEQATHRRVPPPPTP